MKDNQRRSKPKTMQVGHSNDFQTPAWVIESLLPYIPKGTVWECACGKGNLARELKDRGYLVVSTDILTGQDFLVTPPPKTQCQ